VVDTGQSKCYDNRDEISPPKSGLPFYGQNAQFHHRMPPDKMTAFWSRINEGEKKSAATVKAFRQTFIEAKASS